MEKIRLAKNSQGVPANQSATTTGRTRYLRGGRPIENVGCSLFAHLKHRSGKHWAAFARTPTITIVVVIIIIIAASEQHESACRRPVCQQERERFFSDFVGALFQNDSPAFPRESLLQGTRLNTVAPCQNQRSTSIRARARSTTAITIASTKGMSRSLLVFQRRREMVFGHYWLVMTPFLFLLCRQW